MNWDWADVLELVTFQCIVRIGQSLKLKDGHHRHTGPNSYRFRVYRRDCRLAMSPVNLHSFYLSALKFLFGQQLLLEAYCGHLGGPDSTGLVIDLPSWRLVLSYSFVPLCLLLLMLCK